MWKLLEDLMDLYPHDELGFPPVFLTTSKGVELMGYAKDWHHVQLHATFAGLERFSISKVTHEDRKQTIFFITTQREEEKNP